MPSVLSRNRVPFAVLALGLLTANAILGMDAPTFDPDQDSVDGALKSLTWLPAPALQPPAIDPATYKAIDVPVDPAWQKIEEFWQPGVPHRQGYQTDVMVKEGQDDPRLVHKRVGHWIEYDRQGRVLFDGSWNSHGVNIGPQLFYFDPDQTAGLRVPRNEPLPLQRIEVFGARTLKDPVDDGKPALMDAISNPGLTEKISFYPDGAFDSLVTYESGHGKTGLDVGGLRLIKFHPTQSNRAAQAQGFDLSSPVVPQQQAVSLPQLAEFAIQSSGEQALRLTARFNANGQPLEILSEPIGSALPSDPRIWKFWWGNDEGVFNSLRIGDKEFMNRGRPDDVPLAKVRRVVIWRTPGKWEDGISAMGFGMKGSDQKWMAAGPWAFWDDHAKLTGSGSYREGKPQGAWAEFRFVDVAKKHVQIEEARGSYQAGARNGIWEIKLSEGHPDLKDVKETRATMSNGYVRHVTYANGVQTAMDDNFH